jgi:hypothetical protein
MGAMHSGAALTHTSQGPATQSLSSAHARPPEDALLDVLPVVDTEALPAPVLPEVDVPPEPPVVTDALVVDVRPVVADALVAPPALDAGLLAPREQLTTPRAIPVPTNSAL